MENPSYINLSGNVVLHLSNCSITINNIIINDSNEKKEINTYVDNDIQKSNLHLNSKYDMMSNLTSEEPFESMNDDNEPFETMNDYPFESINDDEPIESVNDDEPIKSINNKSLDLSCESMSNSILNNENIPQLLQELMSDNEQLWERRRQLHNEQSNLYRPNTESNLYRPNNIITEKLPTILENAEIDNSESNLTNNVPNKIVYKRNNFNNPASDMPIPTQITGKPVDIPGTEIPKPIMYNPLMRYRGEEISVIMDELYHNSWNYIRISNPDLKEDSSEFTKLVGKEADTRLANLIEIEKEKMK